MKKKTISSIFLNIVIQYTECKNIDKKLSSLSKP